MEKILVTGVTGFIGSHTSLLILKKGFEIFVIDSFVNFSLKSIEKALLILEGLNIDAKNILHFFKGDLKNLKDIENIFQISHKLNKKIEAVIHFAGLKSVSESILEPISYWDSK